jgi:hypothetical protein
MSDCKVLLFKPRPPSKTELDVYEKMTRKWSPHLRQLMFPRHHEELEKTAPSRPKESPDVS